MFPAQYENMAYVIPLPNEFLSNSVPQVCQALCLRKKPASHGAPSKFVQKMVGKASSFGHDFSEFPTKIMGGIEVVEEFSHSIRLSVSHRGLPQGVAPLTRRTAWNPPVKINPKSLRGHLG
jgi:hypothetical protein